MIFMIVVYDFDRIEFRVTFSDSFKNGDHEFSWCQLDLFNYTVG